MIKARKKKKNEEETKKTLATDFYPLQTSLIS